MELQEYRIFQTDVTMESIFPTTNLIGLVVLGTCRLESMLIEPYILKVLEFYWSIKRNFVILKSEPYNNPTESTANRGKFPQKQIHGKIK